MRYIPKPPRCRYILYLRLPINPYRYRLSYSRPGLDVRFPQQEGSQIDTYRQGVPAGTPFYPPQSYPQRIAKVYRKNSSQVDINSACLSPAGSPNRRTSLASSRYRIYLAASPEGLESQYRFYVLEAYISYREGYYQNQEQGYLRSIPQA